MSLESHKHVPGLNLLNFYLPTRKARKPEANAHFDRLLQLIGTNPTIKVTMINNNPIAKKAIHVLSKSGKKLKYQFNRLMQ